MSRLTVLLALCALFALSAAESQPSEVSLDSVRLTLKHTERIIKMARVSMKQATGALSAWRIRLLKKVIERLMRTKATLEVAMEKQECNAKKTLKLKEALAALNAVRKCRYNNLPFSKYRPLRDLCFMRNGIKQKLGKSDNNCKKFYGQKERRQMCRERVARLEAQLVAAQKACVKIGRADGPVKCPSFADVKAAVQAAKDIDCGGNLMSIPELTALVEKDTARVTDLLNGTPYPSNDPRFPDDDPRRASF